MFSNAKKILDIVKYRWVCIAVSVLLLIPAIGSMIYSTAKYGSPLLVGIDFTGGTIIQYTVNEKVANSDVANIRTKLTSAGIENPVIQILSSSDVTKNDTTNIISVKTAFDGEKDTHMTETVTSNIQGMYPDAQLVQVSSVGPTLGKELLQKSIVAIALATSATGFMVGCSSDLIGLSKSHTSLCVLSCSGCNLESPSFHPYQIGSYLV